MSITLTNIEQYSIGSTVVESNPVAAAISPQIDFSSGTIAWNIQFGQLLNGVFTAGSRSRSVTIQLNITNGTWSADGQSGVLPQSLQTQLHGLLVNMRNSMETLSINGNIVAGTQVPWS